jgi:hypothetical protein
MEHATPAGARRPSRKAKALVAAGVTGAIAVAGVASAGAASAAEVDDSTARSLSPTVTTSIQLPGPFGPGGECLVCGLGGFDPIFEEL